MRCFLVRRFLVRLLLCAVLAPWCAAQDERRPLDQARDRWERMGPDERARLEQRFREFRELPEAERARMREHLKRVAEARREIEERIPDELRAKLDQLSPEDRRQVLREYVECAMGERAERLRGKMPAEFLQQLESATPEERERMLRERREAWRDRGASRALEFLGRELALPREEVERIRALPREERLRVIGELGRAEMQRRGPPPGVPAEEFQRWLELPPREFLERMHRHGARGPDGRPGPGGPEHRRGPDGRRGPGGPPPEGREGRGFGPPKGPPPDELSGERERRGERGRPPRPGPDGAGAPGGPGGGPWRGPEGGPGRPGDGPRGPRREGRLPHEAREGVLRALRPDKEWIVELALEPREARHAEVGRRVRARVVERLRQEPLVPAEELARLELLSGREFHSALREWIGDPHPRPR